MASTDFIVKDNFELRPLLPDIIANVNRHREDIQLQFRGDVKGAVFEGPRVIRVHRNARFFMIENSCATQAKQSRKWSTNARGEEKRTKMKNDDNNRYSVHAKERKRSVMSTYNAMWRFRVPCGKMIKLQPFATHPLHCAYMRLMLVLLLRSTAT